MRIIPALLCSAIVYPTVGLNGIGEIDGEAWYGPLKVCHPRNCHPTIQT